MKPVIAITMGDPSGIGPEIIVKLFFKKKKFIRCFPLVFGDKNILEKTCKELGYDLQMVNYSKESVSHIENTIPVTNFPKLDDSSYKYGEINALCGNYSYLCIRNAIQWALQKKISAIVTAPINKAALHQAGHYYDGHTEILGKITKTKDYRMLLAAKHFKTVYVSSHVSLLKACTLVKTQRVYQTIKLGSNHLNQLGIHNPLIAVCGLNPHAGENGLFGKEEKEEILPAIAKAKKDGLRVVGPLPPDTTFMKAYKGEFDLIVVQYHDQGLIPSKMIDFRNGVNVTIGLPIIRTSVDHGTAFDIAGKNCGDSTNLSEAINYAISLSQKDNKTAMFYK